MNITDLHAKAPGQRFPWKRLATLRKLVIESIGCRMVVVRWNCLFVTSYYTSWHQILNQT